MTGTAATHVALIRGINVGRAKRVAMADLRTLMTALGFADGRTLLNSGNLVFAVPPDADQAPAAVAARLEAALPAHTGVTARTIVLTTAELAALLAANPWPDAVANPSRFLVAVLREDEDGAPLAPLVAREWGEERLALGPRVAYLWCPEGVAASRLGEEVARALGDRVTTRTWATMSRLQALAGA